MTSILKIGKGVLLVNQYMSQKENNDFSEALEQIKALYQNRQSAIDTNRRLVETIKDLKYKLFEERIGL